MLASRMIQCDSHASISDAFSEAGQLVLVTPVAAGG